MDLKLFTHIQETLASNKCYVFLQILIWGKLFRKEKNGHYLKFFEIFENFEIFRNFQNFETPR